MYQQGFDYNKEACIQVETASQMLNRTDLISNDFILNYETDCAPPDSLLSIIILISCCALSRCGLWLFDLAVNQMFQEWVKPNQVKSYASQKDIIFLNAYDFILPLCLAWRCIWCSKRSSKFVRLSSFRNSFCLG